MRLRAGRGWRVAFHSLAGAAEPKQPTKYVFFPNTQRRDMLKIPDGTQAQASWYPPFLVRFICPPILMLLSSQTSDIQL